jgi:hypothetical protein
MTRSARRSSRRCRPMPARLFMTARAAVRDSGRWRAIGACSALTALARRCRAMCVAYLQRGFSSEQLQKARVDWIGSPMVTRRSARLRSPPDAVTQGRGRAPGLAPSGCHRIFLIGTARNDLEGVIGQ